jgi:hypothetical protein
MAGLLLHVTAGGGAGPGRWDKVSVHFPRLVLHQYFTPMQASPYVSE